MSEERSLSEELRTAREGRGETLEQVHQRTGIALTILRELEEGEYNVVEPVYARLAINHYATYLGLDGADLEARLRNEVAATRPPAVEMRTSQQPPGQALAPVSPLAELIRSQPPSRLVTIGVIIVVGLAITLYLFGSETADPRASGLRPLPAPRPVATAPAPPVQQQRATAADNTERSATSSEVSSAPAPASATNPPVVAQVTQDPLATVPLSAPDGNISPGTAPETESDATEHVAVVPPVDPQTRPGVADPAVAISPAESGTTPGVPGTTPASTSAVVDSTLVEIAPIAVAGSTSADPDSASGDVAPVAITPPVDDPPDTSRGTPQVALVADTLVAAPESAVDTAAVVPLVLQIDALDSTWVQVQWDDSDGIVEIIPSGEQRTWEAEGFFMVRAGRAHGVHFHFQGKLLGNGRLGDPTKVLRFRASAEGVQLLGADLEPIAPIALTPLDTTEVAVQDRP